jgi:hypothetical protein
MLPTLLALAIVAAPPPPPPAAAAEPVVFGCILPRMCDDVPPASEWDQASCDDIDVDEALSERAQRGDPSALEMLRQRYFVERTYAERYRIAPIFLGRVADDAAVWNDILPHAQNYVDFAGHSEKFAAYCAEHGCEAEAYERKAYAALDAVSADRRARPLLLRALASGDDDCVHTAIFGFALQHDESALPRIDEALDRLPIAASLLAFYDSDAADAVAYKHLKAEDRAAYDKQRRESAAPPE